MSGLRRLGCGRGVPPHATPARCWTVSWRAGRLRGSWLLARVVPMTRCTRWLRLLAEWIRKQTPAVVGLWCGGSNGRSRLQCTQVILGQCGSQVIATQSLLDHAAFHDHERKFSYTHTFLT
jgi:hypothetical protein